MANRGNPRGRSSRSGRSRRGIYLLPTTFTVGNMFCGYAAIVMAFQGRLGLAALLVIIAGVLDALDGRIARFTGATSEFGVQFDSLADMVSFGLAPAVLAYVWALGRLDRIGWLVAFLYVVCAGMRLARFNIKANFQDKRWFAGLPSPMAAGAMASVVFAFPAPRTEDLLAVLATLFAASLGLLMISTFRYRSFKELDLGNRRSYVYVLPLAAIIVAILIVPRWSFLTLATLYLISGPVLYLIGLVRRRSLGGDVAQGRERDGVRG